MSFRTHLATSLCFPSKTETSPTEAEPLFTPASRYSTIFEYFDDSMRQASGALAGPLKPPPSAKELHEAPSPPDLREEADHAIPPNPSINDLSAALEMKGTAPNEERFHKPDDAFSIATGEPDADGALLPHTNGVQSATPPSGHFTATHANGVPAGDHPTPPIKEWGTDWFASLFDPSSTPVFQQTQTSAAANPNVQTDAIAVLPVPSPLSEGRQTGNSDLADDSLGNPSPETSHQTQQDALTILLGGAAASTGDEGIAQGTIDASLVDYGTYSIATGIADFSAIAIGYGTEPDAQAYSYADIEGADIIYRTTTTSDLVYADGTHNIAGAHSSTQFLAIDFDNFIPENGPLLLALPAPTQTETPGNGHESPNQAGSVDSLLSLAQALIFDEGLTQLAQVSSDGTALAPNSYVTGQTEALSVQYTTSYAGGDLLLIA